MNIVTTLIYPPIPERRCDWSAHISGDEEGPIGRGTTEAAALRDLCYQLATELYETKAGEANA